jgi:dTDP-4-dehydrorhamnose 3,5-epimerase-like enzyme
MVIHIGIFTAYYFNFGSSTATVLLKCSSYWFIHHNFAYIWADKSTHAKE